MTETPTEQARRRARVAAIRAEVADEEAETAQNEALERGRGRPSLSGEAKTSPHVAFRAPPQLRVRAERRAAQEGRPVSELAREALERYLDA